MILLRDIFPKEKNEIINLKKNKNHFKNKTSYIFISFRQNIFFYSKATIKNLRLLKKFTYQIIDL